MKNELIHMPNLYFITDDGTHKTPNEVLFSTYTGLAFTHYALYLREVYTQTGEQLQGTDDMRGYGAKYKDGYLSEWYIAEERNNH